ncbi:putative transposase [Yersinia pestis]|nr:putative transposase [Yersinia pestis]
MLTHFILFQLVLYVFLYPGRVFPYRINVIPSTPKLPVTVFELQIAKLLIKHQTALSLQVPHKSRDTHLGRDLQKHMDVIHTAFCFQDIHVFHSHSFLKILPIALRFSL